MRAAANAELEDSVEAQKKELEGQEPALESSQKRFGDCQSQYHVLENFRGVLEHRVREMTEERRPAADKVSSLSAEQYKIYDTLVEKFEEHKVGWRELVLP